MSVTTYLSFSVNFQSSSLTQKGTSLHVTSITSAIIVFKLLLPFYIYLHLIEQTNKAQLIAPINSHDTSKESAISGECFRYRN